MGRLLRLFQQALRSLWSERLYALLMMIGLIIGISSVTIIYEIGQGVRSAVVERMASMGFGSDAMMILSGGGFRGFGRHRGMGTRLTLTLEDADLLREQENVAAVAPHLTVRRTMVSAQGNHVNTRINGVTPEYSDARSWPVTMGRFISQQDMQRKSLVAVLGTTPAREMFPGQDPLGQIIRIGNTPFQVVGILVSKGSSPGGHDFDDRILVPLTTAARRLMNEDKLNAMRVNMIDPAKGPQTLAQINEVLRKAHKLPPDVPDDFSVVTSEALLNMITQQSQSMVVMLTFISAVSLLVSGIVIMNIMLVAVSERAHEIGVRRAVGARRRDVLLQIIMESLLVALAGGMLGLVLGMVVARLFTALWEVPTALNPLSFLLAFLFSAAVGIIFGFIPARRAANLAPVEALR